MKYPIIAPAVCATLLVGGLPSRAQADECNKLTFLTFTAPVELPGVALPPGTYRFAHLDCSADVLQVSSVDGLNVYGMFLTAPVGRPTPSDTVEVVFAKRRAGAPEAIQAWFYPGDTIGDGLIYPGK